MGRHGAPRRRVERHPATIRCERRGGPPVGPLLPDRRTGRAMAPGQRVLRIPFHEPRSRSMMRDLDSTSDPRTDETRMTGSADPGRCAHRMRMWPALPLAFFLATGCTRLPTDAAGGRAARGAATASDLAPTAHVSDVIVQIQ